MPNSPADSPIKKQAEDNKVFNRRLNFSKTMFYPYMVEHTTSAEEAKIFAESLAAVMEMHFQNMAKTMLVEELKLEEQISQNIPEQEREKYLNVFRMFAKQTVSFATAQFYGMAKEIEVGKETLLNGKKLEDIPVRWGEHRPESEDGINKERAENELKAKQAQEQDPGQSS